jgi:formate hydrogenlyase transcriptional activator
MVDSGRPEVSTRSQSANHDLFRLVTESLPGGVLVLDGAGAITFANRELERLFGWSRSDLIGHPIEVLLPGWSPEAGSRLGRRRDGTDFPVDIGVRSVATDRGTFAVVEVTDLTARRQAETAARAVVESQLEFERLVAELSSKFINVPADSVGDAIQDALRRIGEALGLDRCTFFEIHPDGMLVQPVSWQREGVPVQATPVAGRERFPWALETLLAGNVVCFSSLDEIPNPIDRANYPTRDVRSAVTVPLSVSGRVVGAVGFNMTREERVWSADVVHRLRVFAAAFGNVLARRENDEALQRALHEVEHLRDQLHAENVYLRAEVREKAGSGAIVGVSPALRTALAQVQKVAATGSTVLLLGETGTGKELFASRIHELSARHGRQMVRVNCAAIPATLLESELFGREKGAFTGALSRQMGRFELADQSTIFLDEIGDLPAEVQVKLLRVLEERQIERLGSPKPIHVDTRIIAATHRNLEQRIASGAFREDLFYRLNVFPIQIPPLRERVEDIPLLVSRFVEELSKTFGKRIDAVSRENMDALQQYSWPGNVRELRNAVERAMIVATGPRLSVPVPAVQAGAAGRSTRLADVERDHIASVLESTGWRIRGSGGAAERLGLRPTTLETRLARIGLKRPGRH